MSANSAGSDAVTLRVPTKADGAALWRLARDSGKLDLNSSYAYLLWCAHFAQTSVVAVDGGEVVGFVLGYAEPEQPSAAVVWQVAVDGSQRGRGLAGRMLDWLYTRLVARGVTHLETTVTPDNEPSIALFTSFAQRWGAEQDVSEMFAAADFPDEHEPELLHRIGPLAPRG